MLWRIRRDLKRFSRRADPRPEFQRVLRKEFLISRPWYVTIVRPIVASASIVTMLGAGTATYAYASDEVVPDHPLYPIREQMERMEETLAVAPAKRAAVQLKHLKKRVREMEIMAAKQKVIERPNVERFTNGFDKAVRAGDELSNGARVRFDKALSAVEQTQARVLERVKERVPNAQDRERVEAIIEEETRNVTERIEKLQEKRKSQFDLQVKRREAIEQRLPWKLEERDVRILPVEDVNDSLEDATTTRLPPKDGIVPPPKRMPLTVQKDRVEAIRIRLRGIIERGRLQVLRRKDGGVELLATSSTPPGIRLILGDINRRLTSEPGLIPVTK